MPSQPSTTSFKPWNWSCLSSPEFPSLQRNEVHIWRSRLDVPLDRLSQLQSYLSKDEQDRAAQFRFDHHRHHFIIGRGLLRVLLGQYVHHPPQDIRFEYGDRGKPFLANAMASAQIAHTLQFNVSHSGGVALYAIALNRRVGIDLEHLRPMPSAPQLAQRFFTDREYAQLLAQPPEQQELAFFRGWTRKEAYLKATGEGLGGLDTVEVSLLAEQPHRLEPFASVRPSHNASTDRTVHPAPQWSIYDIPLTSNHRAAVVIETKEDKKLPLSLIFFDIV